MSISKQLKRFLVNVIIDSSSFKRGLWEDTLLKKVLTFLYPNYSLKTVDQFYHRVEEFAQCLRAKGCLNLAEKIEIAYGKGSVGSEIIGDIGLALHEIMPKIPNELMPMAKELRHFIRWYRTLLELR